MMEDQGPSWKALFCAGLLALYSPVLDSSIAQSEKLKKLPYHTLSVTIA